MPLKIYNSLTRQKELFVPRKKGEVGIYVCGPTVYDHSHIGHAKSYVSFDVIVKWLREHYRVRYVQNITDVGHLTDDADEGDDKIGVQARINKTHPLEFVDRFMRSYFEDMEALGVAHPNMYVRATQHIGEQIELIERLIEKGHAYEASGNVYFDVPSWPEYGCLSGRQGGDEIGGTRVAARSDKKDPRDFALWKSAEGTDHVLRWNSPWGSGYPGWHVECSAMATKYLGGSFDIHGGGNENKFPHHECEIAQSRAAGDGDFARYWIHHNMINVDGQKMGKSLGNAVYIKDLLKEFRPEAMRLFLLQTHYRRPSNFTHEALQSAESGIDRLSAATSALKEIVASERQEGKSLKAELAQFSSDFAAAMDDDFNSNVAIAHLFDFVKVINKSLANLNADGAQTILDALQQKAGGILGIMVDDKATTSGESLEDPLMDIILQLRSLAREHKDFATSDLIRDELANLGVEVKDGEAGSQWSKKN